MVSFLGAKSSALLFGLVESAINCVSVLSHELRLRFTTDCSGVFVLDDLEHRRHANSSVNSFRNVSLSQPYSSGFEHAELRQHKKLHNVG